MAKWQRKLDIAEDFRATADGKLSVRELALIVSINLDKLERFGVEHDDINFELEDLVDLFKDLADDATGFPAG